MTISGDKAKTIEKKRRGMTRAQILDEITSDPEYRATCDHITSYDRLSDDLYQESFLAICELSDERLIGMHSRGELKWFYIGVLRTMWRCRTSPFFRTYRAITPSLPAVIQAVDDEYDFEQDVIESSALEISQETIEEMKNSKLWYDARMFEIYLKSKSYRSMSNKIKIPRSTIHSSVRRTLSILDGQIKLKAPKAASALKR